MKPHEHSEACRRAAERLGRPCSREWDVDPWSETGAHRIKAARPNPVYGKRPEDLPRHVGWRNLFLKGTMKESLTLLRILAALWLAKYFGIGEKGGAP